MVAPRACRLRTDAHRVAGHRPVSFCTLSCLIDPAGGAPMASVMRRGRRWPGRCPGLASVGITIAEYPFAGSTAVSADFVQRCMRASRSRSVVLLLDCCYGGAFAQGVKVRAAGDVNVLDSFPQERTGGGRGRAVITASSAMEYAFEGDRLADDQHHRPSVFTSALVEGLATGDADRDEDGWVSLNELYDYVFDKVREQNPHQTPSRDVEMQGELYLARSRRRRIKPQPIPADLQ